MADRALVASAALLAVAGLISLNLGFTTKFDLDASKVGAERGHAFAVSGLRLPADVQGDDNHNPSRSALELLEDGKRLGPPHSQHEDIRKTGRGRFSHWGNGLLFSASDNSDPRTNGRRYVLAHEVFLPRWLAYAAFGLAAFLLVLADRVAILRGLARARSLRVRAPPRRALAPLLAPAALLAALVAGTLLSGVERSGWILITQPLEASTHATNTLLGYSWIRHGTVFHKENYSSLKQVAYFSGADTEPDMYFRRPVYAFMAILPASILGVDAALLLINVAGWAFAAWLCYRFTLGFYGDAAAARWAALLASAGIGFTIHVMDLSAHLLSFVFYMAGVAFIHRSQVWRAQAEPRVHFAISAFLALACLQYNTGIALVAAYFTVAVRHNRLRILVPACLLPLLAQPLWGALLGWLYEMRRGAPLADLSRTEYEYLRIAMDGWARIAALPAGEMLASFATIASSFLSFEMPLVVAVAALHYAIDARRSAEGRARLAFALPFILFPFLAALVFAPAATARGYLVYGISILFFASCGAALAALVRRSPRAFLPAAWIVVALSVAWSTAHLANVLGPGKAYFLGMDKAVHLFRPGGWQAASLTGMEPTPRIFGGRAPLREAGLAPHFVAAAAPSMPARQARQAVLVSALFAILVALLVRLATRARWRLSVLAGAGVMCTAALAARLDDLDLAVQAADGPSLGAGSSVEYRVVLSPQVRERLIAGLGAGQAVVLLPAQYTGPTDPTVRVGGTAVAVSRVNRGNWRLDSDGLSRALARAAELEVRWSAAEPHWLGGWQRVGLPGRSASYRGPVTASPVLPAVEVRLVTDTATLTPLFIGF